MTALNRRAVLLICDGHRADFLNAALTPRLWSLAGRGRRFARHTAIFPSATRASAASIATGCWPAAHGLHGNSMGLPTVDGVTVFDVGDPAFLGHMHAALGRMLTAPTLAERLEAHGGVVVASNVSPGAAYFHDPAHFGTVVHRAGSFGPGGRALDASEAPAVSHDAAGDAALTRWFCEKMLREGAETLGVLWLCDPDLSMHADLLGSPTHLAGVAAADACAGMVVDMVAALRARGEDVLLLAGSDHGQESVRAHVAVEAELIEAGLKDGPSSPEVTVAPQGASGLVYLAGAGIARRGAIAAFLRAHAEIGEVFEGEAMRAIGQAPGYGSGHAGRDGLAIAFAMARDEEPNAHGVPGRISVCVSDAKPGKPAGHGSHGGLGRFETHPFLIAEGGGFAAGTVETGRTRLIDLAPTILRHLGLPRDGMDGLALPQT